MTETNVRLCNAGETIFAEGELGNAMYVLLAGRVGVSTARAGQVAALGAGEFFGEMAVIDTYPRSATVTALEDGTRVLPIDQHRFVYLVSQQPAFALSVMAVISRRMRSMTSTDTAVTTAPAAGAGVNAGGGYGTAEIMPGLWQLRSAGRAGNVYLIAGHNRTVLVDTGFASTYPSLADGLRTIGRPPETVDLVVLTHEHADHLGGTALLPRGPIVAAHQLTANKLALGDEFAMVSGVIGEKVAPFAVDICLPEGSVIDADPYRFEVLHTPGHTSSCICLADPAQDVLIVGDMFMAGGAMGGIFGSGSISDYVLSMERLRRLGLHLVLPGHGRESRTGEADAAVALDRAKVLLRDTCELFHAISGEAAFDRIMSSVRGLNR